MVKITMDITRSCGRLSFVNIVSCPPCEEPQPPGALKSKARAEDKAFNQQIFNLFLAAFVVMATVAIFLLQHPQRGAVTATSKMFGALPRIQMNQHSRNISGLLSNFQFGG